MNKKELAIFDLDGTLTRRNSFWAFIRSTHSLPAILLRAFLLSPRLTLYGLGIVSPQSMKESVLASFYKGWPREKLAKSGDHFALHILPSLMREDVYARLRYHRGQGHEVVLLTASCEDWTRSWCEKEQIALIASGMDFPGGIASGRLAGPNCRGEEKKNRLAAAYDLSAFHRIYAYGDRKSDRFYMELAHESYRITRSEMTWQNT